jgi:hypothetical protein
LATVTRTLSVANGGLPPGGLAPGTFIELPISFQLDMDIPPSSEVNYAEISSATGINGALIPDEDSTPDASLGNDNGGTPGVAGEDDEIDDDANHGRR